MHGSVEVRNIGQCKRMVDKIDDLEAVDHGRDNDNRDKRFSTALWKKWKRNKIQR